MLKAMREHEDGRARQVNSTGCFKVQYNSTLCFLMSLKCLLNGSVYNRVWNIYSVNCTTSMRMLQTYLVHLSP